MHHLGVSVIFETPVAPAIGNVSIMSGVSGTLLARKWRIFFFLRSFFFIPGVHETIPLSV